MKNPDKNCEADSPLVTCDFSEIEKRVLAWPEWHEGPIGVSPTGRVRSYRDDPKPQYLARPAKAGIASEPVVNPNEETK